MSWLRSGGDAYLYQSGRTTCYGVVVSLLTRMVSAVLYLVALDVMGFSYSSINTYL